MTHENKRQSAYLILGLIFDNHAEIWHTRKFEVMGEWPKTLEEMEPEHALWIAQGLWQEVYLGLDVGPFYTRHQGFGPKEYDEMWSIYAS